GAPRRRVASRTCPRTARPRRAQPSVPRARPGSCRCERESLGPRARRARGRPRRRTRPRASPGARPLLLPGRGAPRRRPSVRAYAQRKIIVPGGLAATLADHPLDLQRDRERSEVLLLWQLELSGGFSVLDRRDQVANLQLEGIVLVHEKVL